MSAAYLDQTKRALEALTLDELEDLQRYLRDVVVRRRHVVRGLDADELELERHDTDPAPTPRAPLTLDDPGDDR